MIICEGGAWMRRVDVLDARYQGLYAESYVRSLAFSLGYKILPKSEPEDEIDVRLRWASKSRGINVQVKSWSRPIGSDDSWNYRVNERLYNRLVADDQTFPTYLVVVTVPRDPLRFTDLVDDGMLLRDRAYYVSMTGSLPVPRSARDRTKSVRVPKHNVLNAESLQALMDQAAMLDARAS